MGADYIVHWPCDPKLAFGDGNALVGTRAMMEMIKARNRAGMLEENSKVKDLSTQKLTVVRVTPAGRTEEEISHADLMAQAAPLDVHAKSCHGCPANFLG